MQLSISNVKTTKTGKSLVVNAGGKDYFAKLDSGLLSMSGQTIEAETEVSEFNGKQNTWIKKWTKPQAAPAATQPPTGTSGGSNWLPFASNTVAHAISAGLITEPSQIKAWVVAAKEAAENPIPF